MNYFKRGAILLFWPTFCKVAHLLPMRNTVMMTKQNLIKQNIKTIITSHNHTIYYHYNEETTVHRYASNNIENNPGYRPRAHFDIGPSPMRSNTTKAPKI